MTKKSILFYVVVTVFLILFGIHLTLDVMTASGLPQHLSIIRSEKKNLLESIDKCSGGSKIRNLDYSTDRRIKKLYEHQEICNSSVTEQLMVFTTMPNSTQDAKRLAKEMAGILREFERYHLQPIVIVEPENTWGLVDFKEFETGFYDKWLTEYFKELKKEGITSELMGMWVPFPEANIPTWNKNGSTPEDFGKLINKYGTILKSEYPDTPISILLNSATYDNADFDWRYGEYISLVPYVSGITPGLVDSFGIQGFPWIPQRNSTSDALIEPAEYLHSNLVVEAAKKLNVKKVWYNTGTFSKKYTGDPEQTAYLTPLQRKAILDKTLNEMKKLKGLGYSVSVNLFAEDKSDTAEQTDWSYWSSLTESNSDDSIVYKNFVHKVKENDFHLSLYDAYPAEEK